MLINPDLHFTLSIASCILRPTSLISFSTIFFQVFFGLQVPTCPGIFSSVHFLIHSPSCFSTRPSHLNLLFLNTDCMSSNPNLCLSSLLGTLFINLVPTIHLTIFISFLFNYFIFSIERPSLTLIQHTAPNACIVYFPFPKERYLLR